MIKIRWYTFFFFLMAIFLCLVGCSEQKENGMSETMNDQSSDHLQEQDILFARDWHDDLFIRYDDPLQTAFEAYLKHHHIDVDAIGLHISNDRLERYPPYGFRYLPFLTEIEAQTEMYFALVDYNFQEAKAYFEQFQSVFIARRSLRDIQLDYVLIAGYNPQTESFIGYSTYTSEPFEINEENWNKEFFYDGHHWMLVGSQDFEWIDHLRQSSYPYLLQTAIESIVHKDHSTLEMVIDPLEQFDVDSNITMFVKNYYYVILKRQINESVDQFFTELNRTNSNSIYVLEYFFHKYHILGDYEQAIEYIKAINEDTLSSLSDETVSLLEEYYKESFDLLIKK